MKTERFPSPESSDRSARIKRRQFLRMAAAAGAAAALPSQLPAEEETRHGIPRRKLGNTGESVSAIGLGGFHIGSAPDLEASIRLIRTAIDRGITFMDNCWDYHDGRSEVWMGKALRDGYRDKVFLMTKIDGRDRKTASKQIDESLSRLRTDRLDLLQMHEIIRMEDPDRIFAEGGAIEALREAKQAGKFRFVGFTGHKSPDIHLKMLQVAEAHEYRFDTVQMPLNVMDAHFDSFEKRVLPKLVERGIGVLGMKPLGSGMILKSRTVNPVECLHYAMNLPVSVVITGCENMENVGQAIEAATSFKSMAEAEVSVLLAKTDAAAKAGEFEKYKMGTQFDATSRNPDWLG